MAALIETHVLDEIATRLQQEKQRLEQLLSKTKLHLHRSERLPADFAEQAIETENDQVVEALDQEAQIELSQIKKALLRLNQGDYGNCVVCGENIDIRRLEAIPHTPFCITCASEK